MFLFYNSYMLFSGGVAQSGRAVGSYPACHRFKSCPRYQPFRFYKINFLLDGKNFYPASCMLPVLYPTRSIAT